MTKTVLLFFGTRCIWTPGADYTVDACALTSSSEETSSSRSYVILQCTASVVVVNGATTKDTTTTTTTVRDVISTPSVNVSVTLQLESCPSKGLVINTTFVSHVKVSTGRPCITWRDKFWRDTDLQNVSKYHGATSVSRQQTDKSRRNGLPDCLVTGSTKVKV